MSAMIATPIPISQLRNRWLFRGGGIGEVNISGFPFLGFEWAGGCGAQATGIASHWPDGRYESRQGKAVLLIRGVINLAMIRICHSSYPGPRCR